MIATASLFCLDLYHDSNPTFDPRCYRSVVSAWFRGQAERLPWPLHIEFPWSNLESASHVSTVRLFDYFVFLGLRSVRASSLSTVNRSELGLFQTVNLFLLHCAILFVLSGLISGII